MSYTGVKAILGSAVLLLAAQQGQAHSAHNHQQFHKRLAPRQPAHNHTGAPLVKKSVQCRLPDDPDLHFVPGAMNNGFAMSPDQACYGNMWCPIACKPGKVMAQWEPSSSYVYPQSMNGGLWCDESGQPKKAFQDKPYCVEGTGAIKAVNRMSKPVSYCQTVLPGNEAMLIPTVVPAGGPATLAVPDTSYWCATAAHYYINPPGIQDEGCIWGDASKPVGNWSPYVAGANTDANGLTFVKLGWNPVWGWENNGLEKTLPNFGVKIECEGCNGMPCEIAGSRSELGAVVSNLAAVGAGGAPFCVVTVPAGQTASIVTYPIDGADYVAPEGSQDKGPSPVAPKPDSGESKSHQASKVFHARPTVRPGIFHENGTDDDALSSSSMTKAPTASLSSAAAVPTSSTPSEGVRPQQGSAAIVGLIVAFAAAATLF